MVSYHPTATTTYKIRKEIKENPKHLTLEEQARKYNVSIPTIRKWRNRDSFEDVKHGTKDLYKKHICITELEEYIICEIRKVALLPLDDLFDVVTKLGINITRSALHRALQRNKLSNLKKYIASLNEDEQEKTKLFKNYKNGYIHIDIKYLPKIDGKRTYLYVAIDRASRYVFAKIYPDKTSKSANKFLKKVIDFFPFKIKKILTDNGKEFTDKFSNKDKKPSCNHIFDKTCNDNSIEHRLTKPYSPQTNGMVERINGKVTANILDKIKFNSIEEMTNTIMDYFYNYNHHIKHSGINRQTPFWALENSYKNKDMIFKDSLDVFLEKEKSILYKYRVGLDK
jgi:transposase-like protein